MIGVAYMNPNNADQTTYAPGPSSIPLPAALFAEFHLPL
jgi:hypothetical protein